MNDPQRLLDGSGAQDVGRSLLEAGQNLGAPPAGAQAQIWGQLQGLLGPGIGGAGAAGGAGGGSAAAPHVTSGLASAGATKVAATGSAIALGTKLGVLGMMLGAGLFVTTIATRPEPQLTANSAHTDQQVSDPHASVDSSVLQNAPTAGAQMPFAEQEAPRSPASASASVSAAAQSAPALPSTPADRTSLLLREAEGVKNARALLGSGNAAGALAELHSLDSEVPKGVLGQERRVLAIEALAASGHRDQASQQARAFLDANPSSPYAQRLEALAR